MNTVLVLNQDFTPLTICSVQRAFMLVFLEKADLVKGVDDKQLRSITKSYPFPSVVRVKNYIHIPYRGVVLSRHNIIKRDGGKCQYCGTNKDLTIDHVIPRSRGGKTIWTNLVTACKNCNSRKSDYSLEKIGMTLSKKPVKPSYITFLRMNGGSVREDWTPFLNPKKVSA